MEEKLWWTAEKKKKKIKQCLFVWGMCVFFCVSVIWFISIKQIIILFKSEPCLTAHTHTPWYASSHMPIRPLIIAVSFLMNTNQCVCVCASAVWWYWMLGHFYAWIIIFIALLLEGHILWHPIRFCYILLDTEIEANKDQWRFQPEYVKLLSDYTTVVLQLDCTAHLLSYLIKTQCPISSALS